MYRYFFLTMICLTVNPRRVFGQEESQDSYGADSLLAKTEERIKEKFPNARLLNFEYGQSLDRPFESELFGERFQEGQVRFQQNFQATANLPLYASQRLYLMGSFKYGYTAYELDHMVVEGLEDVDQNGGIEFHYFSTALRSLLYGSLFNRPVIYNASLLIDGNENGLERLKGVVGLSFILKQTKRVTMTLGAVVFLDPTSQIPFFPAFSYNYHFRNPAWELDFILPQRLLLRRYIGENDRLSVGSTFGSTGFYVNIDHPDFAPVYEYGQLEIRSGITYEHRFNDYLIGTFRGGVQHFIGNRLTEKGEPTRDFIYQNEQKPTGYFQIGFSIDPFTKTKD